MTFFIDTCTIYKEKYERKNKILVKVINEQQQIHFQQDFKKFFQGPRHDLSSNPKFLLFFIYNV